MENIEINEANTRIKILVLHGPNLNLLGVRETDIYGKSTLDDLDRILVKDGLTLGATVFTHQSNYEGELIDFIHQGRSYAQGILINAGAYTHTSVAIRDALAGVNIPTVEVHISNIYRREDFRHHSYIAPVAIGQISGFGLDSYRLGLRALVDYVQNL